MKLWILRLCAALALGALAACGTGGVLGKKATCTGSSLLLTQVTGECEREIEELSTADTQAIAVQTSDIAPFATVDYEVTVESGRVSVTFVDARGNEQSAEAAPGSPATGSVRVQLDPLNQIKFELAPVSGVATGVKYQLSFVCDCLP